MKVFIVEECTWDHHENIAVFSSYEAAENYCNTHYGTYNVVNKMWHTYSFNYYITDYEVDEHSNK